MRVRSTRGNCVVGGERALPLEIRISRGPAAMACSPSCSGPARCSLSLQHAHAIRFWSGTEGNMPDSESGDRPEQHDPRPDPCFRLQRRGFPDRARRRRGAGRAGRAMAAPRPRSTPSRSTGSIPPRPRATRVHDTDHNDPPGGVHIDDSRSHHAQSPPRSFSPAASAHAETKTLYVGMNGGNLERTYTQGVFPDFEKANNVKVVVVPGTSSDDSRQGDRGQGQAADARDVPR